MPYKPLIDLLNEMASDYMFLSGAEVDVPAAGKFMNNLDKIADKAAELKVDYVREVTRWLNVLLEKIVLDSLTDGAGGFLALGEGIALLQGVTDSYANSGRYEGDITPFGERVSLLTGVSVVAATEVQAVLDQVVSNERQADVAANDSILEVVGKKQPAAEMQVEDESLLHDFIVEGLEYIDEIEVNILNLEKSPENKDYINAIFRPFHSIKGVASFLNLNLIRELAHTLENLLDKARNGELMVTPPVIDVVLEGADALKSLISSLKSRMEGSDSAGEEADVDVPDLMQKVRKVQEGGNQLPLARTRKLGEILVEDGVISSDDLSEGMQIKDKNPRGRRGNLER